MLRKTTLILLLVAGLALSEGVAIYLHASPSLPLSDDYFDYVNTYPAWEGGFALELPTPTIFTVHVEGNYASLPEGGVLEQGEVYFAGVGGLISNDLGSAAEVVIGPQVMFGQVNAKGRYRSIVYEEDVEDYRVDFDSYGNGFGVGILAGIRFALTEHLRLGMNLNASYFGVSNDNVTIIGFNYEEPDQGETEGIYRYEGEYTALSIRITIGYEF